MESEDLADFVCDIVGKVATGEVKPKDACSMLKSRVKAKEDVTLILDCIWIDGMRESEDERYRLQDLVAGLATVGIAHVDKIVELLEPDIIPEEVHGPDHLRRKRTQAKTKKVYTIPKFNLLTECAEGYAAVVDIVWTSLSQGLQEDQAVGVQGRLKELIGVYQLCPTKTLSVIISLMSNYPASAGISGMIELVRLTFPASRVTSVLTFHLLSFGRSEEGTSGPSDPADGSQVRTGRAPEGLLQVISQLSQAGLVNLADLWSIMTPVTDDIEMFVMKLKADFANLNDSVSRTLGGVMAGSDEEFPQSVSSKFSSIISEFSDSLSESQKFKLLAYLIRSNQFNVALPLMSLLQSTLSPIPIGAVESVQQALHDHISNLLVEPSMETESRDLEIFNGLVKIFQFFGIFLTSNPSTTCMLLKWIGSRSSNHQIELLLGSYILPSLSMGTPNPSGCALAWDILDNLACTSRFSVYQRWENAYDETFPLSVIKTATINETRSLLKRVVKGAQVGDIASRNSHYQFAKLCCCNPLVVLKYVVSNIQIQFNYNLIEPYVEVSSKIPALAEDIMSFIVSSSLVEESRPSLNMKTASVEPWLNNLAEFTGRFFKKHPSAPLDAVMRVIVASMKSTSGELLKAAPARVLLEAIIEHMGDFSLVQQLNTEQIEAISGGPVLNSLVQASQSSSIEGGKVVERAKAALKQALLADPSLVRTLYDCLTSQLSDLTTSQTIAQELIKGGGLKLLGLLYDGIFSCLLQLTEFLSQNCHVNEYRSILPEDPLVLFRMDPALAFHILRPGWCEEWTDTVSRKVFHQSTNISCSMYGWFWRLSLSDISVPVPSYDKQAQLLRDRIVLLESTLEKQEKINAAESKEQIRSTKRELQRTRDVANKLQVEKQFLMDKNEKIVTQMRSEYATWWKGGTGNKLTTLELIAEMISKRVFVSIQDAIFCANFVKLVVSEKVVGFQFLDFFNQWTELLAQRIASSSEEEIKNFAEFVKQMMTFVVEMRKNDDFFASIVSNDNSTVSRSYYSPDKGEIVPISRTELARAHMKWEGYLTRALKAGLNKETADWCEKRNCLNIISRTCEIMPVIQTNALDLIKAVQALADDNQEDIATFALSLGRKLTSLENSWMDKSAGSVIASPTPSPVPARESRPEPEERKDEKMEEISDRESSKRPARRAQNKEEEQKQDVQRRTTRRPDKEAPADSAPKRQRGEDRYHSQRDMPPRSRHNESNDSGRTRDRTGASSRR
jgi:hypothetical protein